MNALHAIDWAYAVSGLLAHFGGGKHGAHDLVSIVLGIALILTAVSLVFRQQILARLAPWVESLDDRSRLISTVVLGVFLGVFVSISSAGAGAIGVTVLLLLYPRLPIVASSAPTSRMPYL